MSYLTPPPPQMMPLYCKLPLTCHVRRPFAVRQNSDYPTLNPTAAFCYWNTDVTHRNVENTGPGAVEYAAAQT